MVSGAVTAGARPTIRASPDRPLGRSAHRASVRARLVRRIAERRRLVEGPSYQWHSGRLWSFGQRFGPREPPSVDLDGNREGGFTICGNDDACRDALGFEPRQEVLPSGQIASKQRSPPTQVDGATDFSPGLVLATHASQHPTVAQ